MSIEKNRKAVFALDTSGYCDIGGGWRLSLHDSSLFGGSTGGKHAFIRIDRSNSETLMWQKVYEVKVLCVTDFCCPHNSVIAIEVCNATGKWRGTVYADYCKTPVMTFTLDCKHILATGGDLTQPDLLEFWSALYRYESHPSQAEPDIRDRHEWDQLYTL